MAEENLEPPYSVPGGAFANLATLFTGIPPGFVGDYAGSVAPDGWYLCSGQEVAITTDQGLYDAIGTTYNTGGETSGYFRLPDLRGRVRVHRDSAQVEFDTLGEKGGAKTVTLTAAEMPVHTHVQNSHGHTQDSHNHTQNGHGHNHGHSTDAPNLAHAHGVHGNGDHNHNVGDYGLVHVAQTGNGNVTTNGTNLDTTAGEPDLINPPGGMNNAGYHGHGMDNALGTHGHTVFGDNTQATATNQAAIATNQAQTATNQNAGSGGAHQNLQPYIVMNAIIRR